MSRTLAGGDGDVYILSTGDLISDTNTCRGETVLCNYSQDGSLEWVKRHRTSHHGILGPRTSGYLALADGGVVYVATYRRFPPELATRLLILRYREVDEELGPEFLRGDTDGSCTPPTLTDGVMLFNYLFLSSPEAVPCLKALDTNDSGTVDLTDAVFLLNWIFGRGPEPSPPVGIPGLDPTPDDLECDRPYNR